ncbi:MAG TPA: thermonuclease family protein [Stellaceae bacterium]|nr:thermonuclease family protein [Stellaceae bacterium]
MRVAAAALLWLLAAPALADPAFTDGGPAEAAKIIDGETLALADGRVLRLVGIDVPARGPLAAQAKSALAALAAGQNLDLKFAGNPRDRHGRVLAQLYVGDVWVQGQLLKHGWARVAGTADERTGIPEMLALERQARRRHRGLWAASDYAIVPTAAAARRAGSFALVSGAVAGVINNAGGILLFFGADQHSGFVLTFAPDVVKLCRAAGLDPAALAGKTLLVRGYVDGTRRPTVAVTYPEQIELLRQKKAAPKVSPEPQQSR